MEWFNNDLTKKYIVIFGSLFKDITINKYQNENIRTSNNDIQNSTVIKSIKVPLSYVNKNKLLQRYLRRGNDPTNIKDLIETTLPRIAFQFTNVTYDPSRKLNKNYTIISPVTSDNGTVNAQFTPVPYNIEVELSLLVKKTEEGIKIMEQIIPLFSPQIHVTSNLIPENDVKLDIPIVLNHVRVDENYEGDFNEKRVITWGMNFTIKGYYFDAINTKKLITDIIVNSNDQDYIQIYPSPTSALYTEDYGFTIV